MRQKHGNEQQLLAVASSLMEELIDKHMAMAIAFPDFLLILGLLPAHAALTTVTTSSWRNLRLGLLGQLSDLMNQDKAMIGAVGVWECGTVGVWKFGT